MQPLYFIALLPPEKIRSEVTAFKQYAGEHFGSFHALSSPPHITLKPPFRWEREREKELKGALQRFNESWGTFEVCLNGFDRFDERVIFVDVEAGAEMYQRQKELTAYLEQELSLKPKDRRPWHPHMTIAFRDLSREMFRRAWPYFRQQKYRRCFSAERASLLRHNGKRWEVNHEKS